MVINGIYKPWSVFLVSPKEKGPMYERTLVGAIIPL